MPHNKGKTIGKADRAARSLIQLETELQHLQRHAKKQIDKPKGQAGQSELKGGYSLQQAMRLAGNDRKYNTFRPICYPENIYHNNNTSMYSKPGFWTHFHYNTSLTGEHSTGCGVLERINRSTIIAMGGQDKLLGHGGWKMTSLRQTADAAGDNQFILQTRLLMRGW
ncbi:hypothetical protein EV702DRAFT_1049300 [Suillus placidus]|uniref:Uncharacterized protein n=1 Tax=Suillus placidus TaxID=48579 RepID=A0A9P7CYF1_9AGAM|nr:hypothetical protein EV702DRAFT_1049300 [Suillus placidus]